MKSSSLWWRAILAVLLLVGSYAMALGIVALCFGAAALIVLSGHLLVKLFFLLLFAGFVVLWSILPRFDLVYPFIWYMKGFLRVTLAISRHQELQADAVSASIAGAAAAGSALRKVHAVAPVYAAYWQSDVLPVLERGFLPPIASGFSAFLRVPDISKLVAFGMEETSVTSSDPYDTHPPLYQRLQALGQLGEPLSAGGPAAITLLGDVEAEEQALIGGMLEPGLTVAAVRWDEVGARCYLPMYADALRRQPAAAALAPGDLVRVLNAPDTLLDEAEAGDAAAWAARVAALGLSAGA